MFLSDYGDFHRTLFWGGWHTNSEKHGNTFWYRYALANWFRCLHGIISTCQRTEHDSCYSYVCGVLSTFESRLKRTVDESFSLPGLMFQSEKISRIWLLWLLSFRKITVLYLWDRCILCTLTSKKASRAVSSGLSSLEISSGHRQETIQILESTTVGIQASMRIYSWNAWLQQYRWEIRRTVLLTSSAYLPSITTVFCSWEMKS